MKDKFGFPATRKQEVKPADGKIPGIVWFMAGVAFATLLFMWFLEWSVM